MQPHIHVVEQRVRAFAARRFGVIGRRDALRLGLTANMIHERLESGALVRLHPGVYAIAGSAPSWFRQLTAGIAWYGGMATASHRVACSLMGWPHFIEPEIELTVARTARARPGLIVHRADLPRSDVASARGFPVTRPMRTLIDLSGILDELMLARVLDHTLRRRIVSLTKLAARVDAERRPGVRVLKRLLAARDPGGPFPETDLETLAFQVILDAGLPEPVLQHRVEIGRPRPARIDLAWPDHRVLLEADGYEHHWTPMDWEADRDRRNRLTATGLRVLHTTWREVTEHPDRLADRLRTALERTERPPEGAPGRS